MTGVGFFVPFELCAPVSASVSSLIGISETVSSLKQRTGKDEQNRVRFSDLSGNVPALFVYCIDAFFHVTCLYVLSKAIHLCINLSCIPAAYHPASHFCIAFELKQGWPWSVPGWETRFCWKWFWEISIVALFLQGYS
jgi:hypothetical protein